MKNKNLPEAQDADASQAPLFVHLHLEPPAFIPGVGVGDIGDGGHLPLALVVA